jgi:hypothetical protein
VILIAGVVWIGIVPLLTGDAPYDGMRMCGIFVVLGCAATFITWIPHSLVIDDGYPPNFRHDENTPFTFWYLVAMVAVCVLFFGLAPVLPLLDGYAWSAPTGFRPLGLGPKEGIPLWMAAAPPWGACVFLLHRMIRGLRHHFARSE